jgi:hypothetical protein
VKWTVVTPSRSWKSSSIGVRRVSRSQSQVNARRRGGSISVYVPRQPASGQPATPGSKKKR